MRRKLILVLVALAMSGSASAAVPRLGPHSLHYIGSFRLPAALSDRQTFDYGGTALAYDPSRHGLFVVGHNYYQLTAEVSIPRLRRARRVEGLPRARFLQGFRDATDGLINRPSSCCGTDVGGQLVYRGRLIGTVYVYYDAAGQQTSTHWFRPSTSLRRGRARGLFVVGRAGAGYVSGFLALVPPAWRRALGGPVLTGNCCIPIISRTSFGPAAFSFDPFALGTRAVTTAHALEYYPDAHPTIGPWDGSWNPRRGRYFDAGTTITGMVFPGGARSLLFLGTQGTGPFCYGDPTSDPSLNGKPSPDGAGYCYDPTGGGKGPHTYPYQAEVWAYDAATLAAVRRGRRRPWQVRPYATWRLSLPFPSPQVGGAAYDPGHGVIYVSQQYVDGPAPVIDAYRVSG